MRFYAYMVHSYNTLSYRTISHHIHDRTIPHHIDNYSAHIRLNIHAVYHTKTL